MSGTQMSRSEFLRVRGLRLHLRRWGEPRQPMLVLLHGWLDVSETFHDFVQPLLDRWQVLAPDWRGFGYSEWQPGGYWFPDYLADLDVILDHYAGTTAIALVGHSMGAQAASLYAGLRPARVSRLVCMDGPFLRDMTADQAPARLGGWLDQLRAPPAVKTYASFDQLAARIRVQHPQLAPERALFIARCWGHEDGHGRIRLCADPQHRLNWPTLYRFADTEAIWRRIEAPTLFVDAAQSAVRVIDEAEIARRRAAIRDHRVVRIEGSGPMLHFDRPAETAAAVSAFLSPL
jgi:pimeloyl-ACP methyl ester carboxylesterase